jgi:trehalose/maltose hydrolase-like predicted phosphorylase
MITHRNDLADARRAPAYVANGLIGLRIPAVPLEGAAMLNGYVERRRDIGIEAAAPLPYPIGLVIAVDGVSTRTKASASEALEQRYDFSAGELTSRYRIHGKQAAAECETVTFCSRTEPVMAVQRTTLRVDRPCRVIFAPEIDPDKVNARVLERATPPDLADVAMRVEGNGGLTSCGMAAAYRLRGAELRGDSRTNWGFEQGLFCRQMAFDAVPGQDYVLEQLVACIPSIMHSDPHWQAIRHLREAVNKGFDRLRSDNRAAWADLWRGRIIVEADDEIWQNLADAAFFYLHTSAHAAMPLSVAPFGLSAHHYFGHVFWDCETFVFPPLLLTAPAAARAVLNYRSNRLQAAANMAGLLGTSGLCFPWQSGLAGDEVTPLPYVQMQERHINTDIAFAFAQYAHAAGDDLFLRQQALPVLQGVAEWIASAVKRTERGYELHGVSGIDESHEDVDNDSFTNMSAAVILREAAGLAERLGLRPPDSWRAIAEGMVLPRDAATGAILNYDGHDITRSEPGKWPVCPETLAGFFPMVFRADPATEAATYRHYLGRVDGFLGMPMLSTLAATWAARTGDRALARRLLDHGVKPFLREPFMMFAEIGSGVGGFSGDDATCYMATLGGYLLTLLYGLPGLQLDAGAPEQWGKFPVVLPEGFQRISVERLWIRGRPHRLTAAHGMQRTELKFHLPSMGHGDPCI